MSILDTIYPNLYPYILSIQPGKIGMPTNVTYQEALEETPRWTFLLSSFVQEGPLYCGLPEKN